jgi:hypothetical protein
MTSLPTNRTTANTAAEHVSDHNILHEAVNDLTAANFVSNLDDRLDDERVPVNGSVTTAKIAAGGIAQSAITDLVDDLAAVSGGGLTDGSVTNAKVNASAGIVKSKLAPLAIADADVSAISQSKVTGLTAAIAAKADSTDTRFTDTRTPTDGSVTNAKVNASAAIAKTKLAALAIVDADVSAISQSKITGLVTALNDLTAALDTKIGTTFSTVKGDLVTWDTSHVLTTKSVGAANTIMVADPNESTGLAYKAPGSIGITNVVPPQPAVGEYVVPANTSTGTAGSFPGNTMYLLPIDLAVETNFDVIGTNINAVGTGSGQVIRMGIYNDDGTGTRPNSLFGDYGTMSSVAGTGDRTLALGSGIALPAGRKWLAWVLQGTVTTSPTMVTLSTVNQMGLTNLGNNSHRCFIQGGVSGALPAIGTLLRSGAPPIMGLRVSV